MTNDAWRKPRSCLWKLNTYGCVYITVSRWLVLQSVMLSSCHGFNPWSETNTRVTSGITCSNRTADNKKNGWRTPRWVWLALGLTCHIVALSLCSFRNKAEYGIAGCCVISTNIIVGVDYHQERISKKASQEITTDYRPVQPFDIGCKQH